MLLRFEGGLQRFEEMRESACCSRTRLMVLPSEMAFKSCCSDSKVSRLGRIVQKSSTAQVPTFHQPAPPAVPTVPEHETRVGLHAQGSTGWFFLGGKALHLTHVNGHNALQHSFTCDDRGLCPFCDGAASVPLADGRLRLGAIWCS